MGALYLCGRMILEVVDFARNEGPGTLAEHPFPTLFSLLMFSMLLMFGGWFAWGTISIWFFER